MPIKEVNSPVNTGNARSKLASHPRGSSPGARSNPSRGRSDAAERPEPVLERVGPSTLDRRR
jgi:hypothetical protein